MAETVEVVVPGIWRWHVWDDRIDFESDAHAVSDEGGTVLIDPLPLQENAPKKLEPIIPICLTDICLTAACHQRSAWAVPEDVRCAGLRARGLRRAMDEESDVRYRAGEMLPGGLKAVHTPGPELAHYACWRERSPAVLFCPDLIMYETNGEYEANGELAFIPAEFHDDPEATRGSVRRLLDLSFDVLCMDRGTPITANPHAELRKLLG